MDFAQFYFNGGIFMHAITAVVSIAVTAVVLFRRDRGRGTVREDRLEVADRMAKLAVALGTLGSLFGLIEMGNALATVEPEHFDRAMSAGLTIMPIPLAWAVLCSIPVWIATTGCTERAHPRRSPAVGRHRRRPPAAEGRSRIRPPSCPGTLFRDNSRFGCRVSRSVDTVVLHE